MAQPVDTKNLIECNHGLFARLRCSRKLLLEIFKLREDDDCEKGITLEVDNKKVKVVGEVIIEDDSIMQEDGSKTTDIELISLTLVGKTTIHINGNNSVTCD